MIFICQARPSQRVHWWAPRRLILLLALDFLLASSLTIGTFAVSPQIAHADAWSSLQAILARNTSVSTSPPTATPSSHVPDGPLMGNGHMMAVVGGTAAAQTYYVDATDYWNNAVPKTIGGITVSISALSASGTKYQQAQDINMAEVRSTFANSSETITERSWISANEDTMVLILSNASGSSASPSVTVKTFAGAQDSLPTTAGLLTSGPNTMWATRTTNSSTWLANAALATRILNDSSATYSTDNSASASGSFTLKPGQSVVIATALGDSAGNVSGSPWPAPATLSTELSRAQTRAAQLNATAGNANSVLDGDTLHNAHLQWWKNFWLNGASMDLGGGIIERYWYTSLYAMAASNRAGFTAPGMQNFETTDKPDWAAYIWTNDYNFEMPYQGGTLRNQSYRTKPTLRAGCYRLRTGCGGQGDRQRLPWGVLPEL